MNAIYYVSAERASEPERRSFGRAVAGKIALACPARELAGYSAVMAGHTLAVTVTALLRLSRLASERKCSLDKDSA